MERRFRIPDDVNITYIQTWSDLGFVLNFDAEQARRDLEIGYLDGMRAICGLAGRRYYLERGMTEREALDWLLDHREDADQSLRAFLEEELRLITRDSPEYVIRFQCAEWWSELTEKLGGE